VADPYCPRLLYSPQLLVYYLFEHPIMVIFPENLSSTERSSLSSVLEDNNKMPDLEDIWAVMDAAWEECQRNLTAVDERITSFYSHPVWLLNGLFIAQHAESQSHRRDRTEYVTTLKAQRVADFGGGYGSLARMIGSCCPSTNVHIIEPHPFSVAVSLSEQTPNVRYMSEFLVEYDVLIATDVFEHVPDPLALVESTAAHLRMGGEYLIANCFWPVIRCHQLSISGGRGMRQCRQ
jgi:hypothetical protein